MTSTLAAPLVPTRPARRPIGVLARTELRLFLREPVVALMGLLLPTVLLVALGVVPALHEPSPTFGGGTFIASFTPSLLGWSLAFLALQTLPSMVVGYREKGVLRRLSATPMRPAALLGVQLAIYAATAVLGMLLTVAVAVAFFGLPLPVHPLAFAVTFLVGVASMFALGLLIAALAPRARAAAGFGVVTLLLTQFFGGLYLPKFLLPDVVNRIGEFVPPGIGAFQAAWTGSGAQPLQLAVLAVIAGAAAATAVRFFRWE